MTRRAAFTLVEMMVALAVTGVLTVMMLRMFSDSSTIWKSEDDRLDTFREARAALQLMSRELATAIPLPDAKPAGLDEFPVIALRDMQSRSTPDLPANYYRKIYSLSSTPNSGQSDLCALGYFLEWEPDIATDPADTTAKVPRSAFTLRRQMLESNATFALLKLTLNATAPVFGESAFSKLYRPTGTTTDTIASYVWDLQFALPPPVGGKTAPAPTNAYYGRELPQWIEIRFKALGANAARLLSGQTVGKELWSDPNDPKYVRLIMPHEQQFVSRVKLTR
jgi:prepilin-type N-terminal cleavage/methylation domain-containing protein